MKPEPGCTPTTAQSLNSVSVRVPTQVTELCTPDVVQSSRSSAPGRCESKYIRDDEMFSLNKAVWVRSKAGCSRVRYLTAWVEAILKLSL